MRLNPEESLEWLREYPHPGKVVVLGHLLVDPAQERKRIQMLLEGLGTWNDLTNRMVKEMHPEQRP